MTKRGLISKGRRLAAERFLFFAFGAGAFLSPLHVIAHEFKSLSGLYVLDFLVRPRARA